MSQTRENRGDQFASESVPAEATAGNADEWPIWQAPYDCTITAANWIPQLAVTGAATNNFALAVNDLTSTTTVSSAKTYASGTNSVANTAEALTVAAGGVNVAAGDVITLKRTVNGSGVSTRARCAPGAPGCFPGRRCFASPRSRARRA